MSTVAKATYFGATGAERRRVAKALAEQRLQRDRANTEAARIRETNIEPGWKPWEMPRYPMLTRVTAAKIEAAQQVPISLLAHNRCGRPASLCTCVDAEGKPLDWALS